MIPIAIIQDNAKLASPLQGILKTNTDFYVTRTYYFPNAALQGLQENPVDIVIVDMHIQHQGGIEWMKEIRNKIPFTKWLIYTAHHEDEIIFKALRAGANGYILKNAQPEQLKNALHDLMKDGAPLSPGIINKLLAYFHHLPQKESDPGMLSHREKEILHFTSRGMIYKEIAMRLGIQRETVKKHLSKIYDKLHVQNKIEALNKFYGL